MIVVRETVSHLKVKVSDDVILCPVAASAT